MELVPLPVEIPESSRFLSPQMQIVTARQQGGDSTSQKEALSGTQPCCTMLSELQCLSVTQSMSVSAALTVVFCYSNLG
jgi:hypothetical protein